MGCRPWDLDFVQHTETSSGQITHVLTVIKLYPEVPRVQLNPNAGHFPVLFSAPMFTCYSAIDVDPRRKKTLLTARYVFC